MTAFTIDLVVILIMAFCVWQGYRKGLVLSLAGILIVFIAAFGAGQIASDNAYKFSAKVQPLLEWIIDDAIDVATKNDGLLSDIQDNSVLLRIGKDIFSQMGISDKETQQLSETAIKQAQMQNIPMRDAFASTFWVAISYIILVVISFVALMILLTILIHFIASVFKLPVIKHFDKYGGLAFGLIQGLLIIGVIGFALRYTGKFVPPEMLEKTFFLKIFSFISVLHINLKF